jgi:hypothetical protein
MEVLEGREKWLSSVPGFHALHGFPGLMDDSPRKMGL